MKIAIDASSITIGGGVTHLTEIFNHLDYKENKFDKIILWGNSRVLKKIKDNKKLEKINIDKFSNSLIKRLYWNIFLLPVELKKKNCKILFSLGGLVFRKKIKTITMCRNMHPFELKLSNMYGISIYSLRLIILNLLMKISFRRSDAIIFLTKYAKRKINKICKLNKKDQIIIPHGMNEIFRYKSQNSNKVYNKNKINLIYVSTIEPYKNHINLISAIRSLKTNNFIINLNLIGKIHPKLSKKFLKTLKMKNPKNISINYLGHIEHKEIHKYYHNSDIGVFASNCENMPNILVEMMSSKLPIACSRIGPMKEILKDGGIYFNPYNIKSICSSITKLVLNKKIRNNLSLKASSYSRKFSWEICSKDTFEYLYKIASK